MSVTLTLTLTLALAVATAGAAPGGPSINDLAAIEATCFDYVDGQLQADPDRIARALHPDLAGRAVIGDTPYDGRWIVVNAPWYSKPR